MGTSARIVKRLFCGCRADRSFYIADKSRAGQK
jgi:hypothetical protein